MRQLTKQIRDKEDHQKKLSEELSKDEKKRIELEKNIKDLTLEMEKHRTAIDDYNKNYYDYNKSKDQCQATRKEL